VLAPESLEATLRDDAALSAACFASPAEGWAVGDRGAIWHTGDGGATWQQQQSHVTCPLTGVSFLDAKRGWVVGGARKPYSGGTSGVVLATVDGGATWTAVRGAELLPALRGVRFFNAVQAIAYGASSPMFASGTCLTRDGGRSWQPAPSGSGGQWLAGDFLEGGVGALAGANGCYATLVSGEVKPSPLESGSLRSLHAMRLIAPTGGWLVGDGGLVAATSDLGRSWQTPAGDLPNGAGGQFDFRAVAVMSGHVWIAGSPGSQVFHSSDGGNSWQAFSTGQTAPIRALAGRGRAGYDSCDARRRPHVADAALRRKARGDAGRVCPPRRRALGINRAARRCGRLSGSGSCAVSLAVTGLVGRIFGRS
jgi:photosystem II stability/assembly factor-like uncharacterized protein